jgi:hypothetical protein
MRCIVYVILLPIYLIIGSLCFQNALLKVTGLDAPWYADIIGGFFLGWLSFILTIIFWIMDLAGFHGFPIFHLT